MTNVPSMEGADWVKEVTTKEKYTWGTRTYPCGHRQECKSTSIYSPKTVSTSPKSTDFGGQTHTLAGAGRCIPSRAQASAQDKKFKVAAIDCGIKFNILRILDKLGCEIHVFPATSSAEEIKAINPDGLFVSNGPGDPAAITYVIETLKEFFGVVPVFGICLGHQMLGLALGGKTFKLKFGHHGANHPVKDMLDNRIGITSQSHGFCVDVDSFAKGDVEIIGLNLNDKTIEGIKHAKYPILSVQHHPEAAPGPRDAQYLFKHFIGMMEKKKVAC